MADSGSLLLTAIRELFGPAFVWVRGFTADHHGIDLSAARGTPVRAVADGIVSWQGYAGTTRQGTGAQSGTPSFNFGGGRTVDIRVGGNEHQYAHLDTILVKAGQTVKRGDIIGTVGSTGNATGPHLHFAIWNRATSAFVDPLPYIKNWRSYVDMLGAWGDNVTFPVGHILTAKDVDEIIARLDALKFFDAGLIHDPIGNALAGNLARDKTREILMSHIGEPWNKSLQDTLQKELGLAATAAADVPFKDVGQFFLSLGSIFDPGFWIRVLALFVGLFMTAFGGISILRSTA